MNKKNSFAVWMLIILSLTACSPKIETPDERLTAYIQLWENEAWADMYDGFFDLDTKEQYPKNEFLEKVESIYEEISMRDLTITIDLKNGQADEEDALKMTYPAHIQMKTVAGEINFTQNLRLQYDQENEEDNWMIQWQPSHILPDLTMEDVVSLVTNPAMRGEIMDRNGVPLAINGSGAEVGVVAGSFDLEGNGHYLANVIGVSKDFIVAQLGQSWVADGHFVPLKKIPFTHQEKYEEALRIPGVSAMKAEMREYPYAEIFAHLIGYTGAINAEELEEKAADGYREGDVIGKRGLEQLLEGRLRGEAGVQLVLHKKTPEEASIILAEKEAIDGEDISLTVDATLQKKTYEEMKMDRGTAAAIDPITGETLVLLSTPSFDPNEFSLGISNSRYESYTRDPGQPLLNRFSSSYVPGSSIKPITAAIGLEAGTIDPNATMHIEGLTWQKDASWKDYKVTRVTNTPNPVNLEKALVYSDNIYFAKEVLKMKTPFIEGLSKFGFGEQIPYKYGLRSSQISNDGTLQSEGQLIDTSFGQGEMLVNILHLASTYGAILNEGTMIAPVLFSEEEKGQIWKEGLLSSTHAKLLKEYLRSVVTDGFLEDINLPSFEISGKTGTAELKSAYGSRQQENGFFVAYPTASESYIMAMMIEHIEDKGGSIYVARKVANVMQAE